MEERIPSAHITDNETGVKYELDFNRESIAFAERHEFALEDVARYPSTGVANLFYYAFRMHHKSVSREKTDKLMEKWGGLPEKLISRLIDLYKQAQTVGTILTTEEAEKNAAVTLEL